MAAAVADPMRARILTEISHRPVSPSQFVEAVGGDISSVGRSFRQLERWGYAEVVAERPAGRGGASVRHVYGRAPQPFETPMWERISRGDDSLAPMGAFFTQVERAVALDTFDQELDRHLSHDEIVLDPIGWADLAGHHDELMDLLAELEVERIRWQEPDLIPTIVGLSLFRAARPAATILRTPLEDYPPALSRRNRFQVSSKMAKVLSNPWRSRILTEMASRPMSPSQFVEEVGGEASYIARCFRELAEWDLVELVEERRGGRHGGGLERIYKSVQRMFFDNETWLKLPMFFRVEVSTSVLRDYVRRIDEAVDAGVFEADPKPSFAWKAVVLDRAGWRALAKRLDRILFRGPEIGRESIARAAGNVEELIPAVAGMAAFRSATDRFRSGSPDAAH